MRFGIKIEEGGETMKIEIKSRWDGHVIFSVEAGSLKDALEIAIKSRADLSRANLYGADLSGANLNGANLSGADLSGADLSGANLSGADLSRANLYRANLNGANLSGANLSGADLSRANLSGAVNLSKYLTTPLLMLLDQPGPIRAYKIINTDGEGIYSRENGYKPINYLAAESFDFPDADADDTKQCAAGGNLATLDWCMKEWKPGYRILVMEFTAADIAAIPTATDGKFRVRRCKRVGEKDLKEIGLAK